MAWIRPGHRVPRRREQRPNRSAPAGAQLATSAASVGAGVSCANSLSGRIGPLNHPSPNIAASAAGPRASCRRADTRSTGGSRRPGLRKPALGLG
jgi:hypothetical protein